MFKRMMSLLLALSLLISVCPVYAAAETAEQVEEAEVVFFGEEISEEGGSDEKDSDEGTTDEGTIDEGTTDEGTIDEGTTDEGTTDEGTIDEGTTDEGTTDEGTTDEGTTDEGTIDEGTTDEGTTDEGTTDEGTIDEGTTDEGTTDEGTTDEGTIDEGTTDEDTTDEGTIDEGTTDEDTIDEGTTNEEISEEVTPAAETAEEETSYETFSLGESKSVTIPYNGNIYYSVTVEEDGLYTFYESGKQDIRWSLQSQVSDGESTWFEEEESRYRSLTMKLSAGKAYQVCAENQQWSEAEESTFTLNFIEAIAPDSIEFWSDGETYMVGETGSVGFDATPWYAGKAPEMRSSDESVVKITDCDYESVSFEIVNAGTAYITDGTDTIQIRSKASTDLTVGSPLEVSLEENVSEYFSFTPTEDGYYTFWEEHDNSDVDSVELYLEDENGDTWYGSGRICEELTAGATYTIRAFAYEATGMTLTVTQSVPAESFSLDQSDVVVQAGNGFNLYYQFAPYNAIPEEITWTSSDENVVCLDWSGDENAYFRADTAGTAEITARTENGLAATCTVTVESVPVIKVDDAVSGTLAADSEYTYEFTAPETATYVLVPLENTDSYWYIWDENGSNIDSSWVEEDHGLSFACEAGKTYRLTVENWYDEEAYYRVQLVKAADLEWVTISSQDSSSYAGQRIYLGFEYGPANADPSQIIWSVGDENLAEIDYINNQYGDLCLLLKKTGTVTVTAALSDGTVLASFDVNIEAPEGDLTVGTPVNVSLKNRDSAAYSFTAPADGNYVFWSGDETEIDNNYYGYLEVWDSESRHIVGGYDKVIAEDLQAGETYLVIIENQSERSLNTVLNAARAVKPTGISFQQAEYSAYSGEGVYIELNWFPINAAYETVTWSTSDSSIAEIDWDNDYRANILLKGEGTATITATTSSGLTASCTVTGMSRTPVYLNDQWELTLAGQESAAYVFTAPADGKYIIRTVSEPNVDIEVYDVSDDDYDYGGKVVMDAKKGDVFHITCTNYYLDGTRTFNLTLEKAVDVTSIQLDRGDFTGYLGDTVYVELDMAPGNAYSEITWESSNPEVADFTWHGDSGADIQMYETGTTTITATADNGISDSLVLTVAEADVLTVGDSVFVTLPGQGQKAFQFTPTESGYYVFYKESSNYSCGVSAQPMNSGGMGSTENRAMFYANAGETYLLKVYCYGDQQASYTMKLDRGAELEYAKLLFDMGNDFVRGMVDSSSYVRIEYTPGNAIYESVEWSVENTDIAEVQYDSDTHANIYLKQVGETTLTVTIDDYVITAPIVVIDAPEIEAPYSKTHVMEPGETLTFRFTAPSSGEYVIWDASTDMNYPLIQVLGPEGGWGNSLRTQFTATKGTTYDIYVQNNQPYTANVKLKLAKAVTVEKVEFAAAEAQCWVGMDFWMEIKISPLNGNNKNMKVKVNDSSIVEVGYVTPTSVQLIPKKAGTAKVTVTCGDLKDTLTMTVKKPAVINAGEVKKITVDAWDGKVYKFTAPETATYAVWETGYGNCQIQISDSNGMGIDWDYSREQFNAVEGAVYYIYVWNNNETEQTFNINVDKVVPLTDFSIGEGTLYTVVGQRWQIIPEATPGNADLSGITWTVSDDSLAYVESPNETTAVLYTTQEGTFTLTATVGDVSRSIEVVVESGELTTPTVEASNVTETGKPKLTWDAVPGAVEYKVYRATSKSGTYSLKKTVEDTSYVDTSATAGKTYYYRVVAVSAGGVQSKKSSVVSRLCDLAQPEITLSNVASSGKIKVAWAEVEGTVEYKVYRATGENGEYELVKTTTSKSYTDTSATAGKTYYYKVRAIAESSGANSAYSEIKSLICKLERPAVEISVSASTGKIKLEWVEIEKATAYEIYRSDNEDAPVETVTDISWIDETAVLGTEYTYRVKALAENVDANSALSSADSAIRTLPRPTLNAMTNDAATGSNVVSWKTVEDAVGYEVYRASSKDGTYTLKKETTEESYTDTSGTPGKTYYYKVKAIAEMPEANSAFSSVKSRMRDLAQPEITLSNVASSGKIKVTWAEVEDAVEYEVYRATSENGEYALVKTTTSKSYTNTSADVGETYYYKVRAIAENTSANSAYSKIKSLICKLGRPVVEISVDASTGKIKLEWAEIEKATAYEIYRSDNENTPVATVTEISWIDETAVLGTEYTYRVKALAENADANSVKSTEDSATRILPQPKLETMRSDGPTGGNIVSWEAVAGAVSYEVHRATSKTGTYKEIAETTELSHTDTSGTPGKTYYYKVKAIAANTAANSEFSSVKSRMRDLAQPVITLSNVASSGKIKVAWAEVEDAVEYKVYRATSEDGKFELVKTTTSKSYTNTSAVAGETYYYKVRAIAENTSANSAYSESASLMCKLARPTVTISNVASSGKIKLEWDEIEKATAYEIYRSDNEETPVATVTAISWTDNDEDAVVGTEYTYRVKALAENADANSAKSTADSAVRKLPRPVVSIAKNSKGKPKLTWEAVDGAVSYKVYRATSKSGTYSLRKTTTSTSYTDSNATSGKTYYYKVVAVASDTAANSAKSSVDSIKSE